MSFGPYLGFTHVNDILGRLYGLGCTLEPSTVFGGTAAGEAVTRHIHSRQVQERPLRRDRGRGARAAPTPRSAPRWSAPARRLLLAGDAVAPRTALHAFREGDDAGRAA